METRYKILIDNQFKKFAMLDPQMTLASVRSILTEKQVMSSKNCFKNDGQNISKQCEESLKMINIVANSVEIHIGMAEAQLQSIQVQVQGSHPIEATILPTQSLNELREILSIDLGHSNYGFFVGGDAISTSEEESMTTIKDSLDMGEITIALNQQQIYTQPEPNVSKGNFFTPAPQQLSPLQQNLQASVANESDNIFSSLKMKEVDHNNDSENKREAMAAYIQSSHYPECLEKYLLLLLSYMICKKQDKYLLHIGSMQDLDSNIQQSYQKFNLYLKVEDLQNQEIESLTNTWITYNLNKQWSFLLNQLRQIKYQIMPLNVQHFKDLVQSVDIQATKVQGQDAILFLGQTGSGKSTSIIFLSGAKMEAQHYGSVYHIGAKDEEFKNPDIQNIKSNPYTASVTQSITAVKIVDKKNYNYILTDTPGFGDQNGAEVDLANGISVIRAIHGAKSVRPVIVISQYSAGDRLEGIKELVLLLTGMISQVHDQLRTFNYIFTKFTPERQEGLGELIKDLKDKANEEQKANDSFVTILDDILEKFTDEEIIFLDPLTDNYTKVLNKITKNHEIKDPQLVFKFYITQKSQQKLDRQLTLHYKSVQNALKKQNYPLIIHKLNEIQYISEILQSENIKNIYKDLLKEANQKFVSYFEETKQKFEYAMDIKNNLSIEVLQYYQYRTQKDAQANDLKKSHLGDEAFQNEQYNAFLIEQANKVFKMGESVPVQDSSTTAYLNKLQVLSSFYPEMQGLYEQLLNFKSDQINELSKEFFIISRQGELEKGFEILEALHISFVNIQNFFPKEEIEKRVNEINETYELLMQEQIGEALLVLVQPFLKIQQMIELNKLLKMLIATRRKFQLQRIIYQKVLVSLIQEAKEKIIDFLKNHIVQMQQFLEKDVFNNSDCLKARMEQVTQLREHIEEIQQETSQSYYQTQSSLVQMIKGMSSEIENKLQLAINSKKLSVYGQIAELLDCFEKFEWIDSYELGVYSEVQEKIKLQVLNQASLLKESALLLAISLCYQKNLEGISSISYEISQVHKLKVAAEHAQENFQEEIDKWMSSNVSETFDVITQQMESLDKVSFETINTINLNKLEDCLNFLKEFTIIKQPQYSNQFILLKNKASNLEITFTGKIKVFNVDIYTKLRESFEIVKTFNGTDKLAFNERANFIQHITTLLQKIQQLKGLLKQEFDPENKILIDWKASLSQFSYELQDELNMAPKNQAALINVMNKLKIASQLMNQDELHGGVPFKEIYTANSKVLNIYVPEQQQRVSDQIFHQKYRGILTDLQLLESKTNESNVAVDQFQNLIGLLGNSVEDLIQQTNTMAKQTQHAHKLTEQDYLEKIVNKLYKLQEAKIIEKFIPKTQEKYIDSNLEKIITVLNFNVRNYMKNTIEGQITTHFFLQAQDSLLKVSCVMTTLADFVQEETNKVYADLLATEEKTLKELVQQFQSKKIKDFIRHSPKDVIAKLSEVQANTLYNSYKKQIEEVIMDRFKEEITQILTEPIALQKGKLKFVKIFINSLPQQMQDALDIDIQMADSSIDDDMNKTHLQFQDAIEAKDYDQVKQFLLQSRNNKNFKEERDILEFFRKEMLSIKMSIEKNIKKGFTQFTISLLCELDQVMLHFKENFPKEQNNDYKLVESVLKNKLKDDLTAITSALVNCDEESDKLDLDEMDNSFESKSDIFCVNGKDVPPLKSYLLFQREYLIQFDTYFKNFNELLFKVFKTITDKLREQQCQYQKDIEDQHYADISKFLYKQSKQQSIITKIIQELESYSNDEQIGQFVDFIVNKNKEFNSQKKEIVDEVCQLITSCKDRCKNIKDTGIQQELDLKNHWESLQKDLSKLNLFIDLQEQLPKGMNADQTLQNCQHDLQQQIKRVADDLEIFLQKLEQAEINNCEKVNSHLILLKSIEVMDISLRGGLTYDYKQLLQLFQEKIKTMMANSGKLIEGELLPICDQLVKINRIGMHISELNSYVSVQIEDFMSIYVDKKGLQAITKLGILLDKTMEGKDLQQNCSLFKANNLSIFSGKTSNYGIADVMLNITGDNLDKQYLQSAWEKYEYIYHQLVNQALNIDNNVRTENIKNLVSNLKIQIKSIKRSDLEKWRGPFKQQLPEYIAYVCAVWTVQNSQFFFQANGFANQNSYLLQPHPAQIIAIFRMLGLGTYQKQLDNNLVQIGTGEGKSITLAITASILALLGFEVNCACYSEYLSSRDFKDFKDLFQIMGVQNDTFYGTFNQLCERIINHQADVRNLVASVVSDQEGNLKPINKKPEKLRILLIDEVDVFFSKDFYGELYCPQTSLKDPTITSLIGFIWQNKTSYLTLADIKKTQEYLLCITRFKYWETLIDEAIKDMLSDVTKFKNHHYITKNQRIGYKEQDNLVFNISFGYQTLFAYYAEYEKGNVSKENLEQRIAIGINCGMFSFAEIPKKFVYTIGVTGTLQTLTKDELEIIKNDYKINTKTYLPSMFGPNQLIFNNQINVKVSQQKDYFTDIQTELLHTINNERAVLIFFDDKTKLMEFYNSQQLALYKNIVRILTEEATQQEKEQTIKLASSHGSITLLTRSFGRGTDFKQNDPVVLDKGGVHVIQTFLSAEKSEEVQIKGRTARQGDRGSYSMIVLESSLEKFGITGQDLMDFQGLPYTLMDEKRNQFFMIQYNHNKNRVSEAQIHQLEAEKFLNAIFSGDSQLTLDMLRAYNKGAEMNAKSRTIILMDATGSMYWTLNKTKATVGKMFQRAQTILQEEGYHPLSFQVQLAAYRNWNSYEQDLLQVSPWTFKPDDLIKFLNGVSTSGGMGNEAIEVGMWHAKEQNNIEKVTQLILIGDYPPNTREEVKQRKNKWSDYWKKTKYWGVQYYEDELQHLIDNGVPVHAFYVNGPAKVKFAEIARETGGKSQYLDIESPQGEQILTDLVTQEILRNVGGDKLVEVYQKRYLAQ